uniref:Mobility group protein 1A n=1 Tax=Ceratitis capitata TaxID=7213 RepID=W8BHA8_CERCA
MSDKPKRPLSAYMLWLNSAREQIKRENPGIKVTEVAKKGGELWRAMKDKSEWEAKAAKAKENYEDAVREFEANGGSSANGNTKKRGKAAKKPAKKSKKAESEDDDDDDDEESE